MKFKSWIFKRTTFIGLMVFVFAACSDKLETPSPIVELPEDYSLIFQDEFNGGTLDTAVWRFHNLGKRRSAINVKEACLLNKGGELEIRNWTELQGIDTIHHAGMIETKENFTFGYYEARIKFDIEMGSWGAFWIMYPNFRDEFSQEDNPKEDGVEIDIMEFVPTDMRYGCHNLHWNGYGKFHKSKSSGQLLNGKLEGYHVYSLLWTPEKYIFYVDGEPTWTVNEAVSHKPEFIN